MAPVMLTSMDNRLDWEQLDMIAETFGDEFKTIIGEFLDDLPKSLDALKTAIGEGNADAVRRSAHQIKGSCANFGFAGVSALASALEQEAKAGNLESAAPAESAIRESLGTSIVALRERYPSLG